MHNYAGNPASFPANVSLIDDSDAPNAGNFNPGPQLLADRTAYLDARTRTAPALNWNASLAATPLAIASAAYDPKFDRWLLLGSSSAIGQKPVASSDGGFSWYGVGGGGTLPSTAGAISVAVHPTSGDVLVLQNDVGGYGSYWTASSNTWSGDTTKPGGTPVTAATQWFAPASAFVSVWGVSGANSAHTRASGAQPGAGAWLSLAMPANFAGATGGNGILMAQSPTRLLVGYPGITSHAYLASTDDGLTWTDRSYATITAGVLLGLAYDSQAGLFVALVSGVAASVYTSPDGVTWTACATNIPGTYNYTSIACMGRLWVVSCTTGPGGVSPLQCALLSVDGGVTWRHASGYRLHVLTSGLSDSLLASPTQFMAFNGNYTSTSLLTGLTPVA